jgi:chaperonin GroEL
MRATQTLIGAKARKAVIDGVNAIYKPVSLTLGPQAKKALLYRTMNRGSRIVDDGYTVAECQEPKDPFIRMAAHAFREGTMRTNVRVGDGTTTTTVIGGKLMNDLYNSISSTQSALKSGGLQLHSKSKSEDMGVMTLRAKILQSAKDVKDKIRAASKEIATLEDLEKIAEVSVDDPEVGKIVAKMAYEVGADGYIDVTEGYKGEIETEIGQGFRFPAKVPGKGFLTDAARFSMIGEDCDIIVTNHLLENVIKVGEVINPFITKNPRMVIVAPKFSDELLNNIFKISHSITKEGRIVKKDGVVILPVHAPSLRSEELEDLAVFCGARFIDKTKGQSFESLRPADVGHLDKIVVKDTEAKEDALIIGGKGSFSGSKIDVEKGMPDGMEKESPVNLRIKVLKGQLLETRQDNFKRLLERRIGSLTAGRGVIRVGDSTDASSLYRKLKIEDAVNACKAALKGGYVKGGGLCLKEIADDMQEDDMLKQALLAPYNQIQSSVEGGIEIGPDIIDSTEMIYWAVEHATQIAANLITVEILTPEMEDPIHGEGEFAIAAALGEYVISQKKHLGQLQDSEEEAERDRMNGLSVDEMVSLDNG